MLPPAAEAALAEKKRMIHNLVDMQLLTEEQGWVEIQRFIGDLFRTAAVDARGQGERNVGCTCPDCGTLHIMKADVVRYTCKCAPYEVRYSAQNSVPLV